MNGFVFVLVVVFGLFGAVFGVCKDFFTKIFWVLGFFVKVSSQKCFLINLVAVLVGSKMGMKTKCAV